MRPTQLHFLCLAALCFLFTSIARTYAAADQREEDHASLRALRDKVTTALNQLDASTLTSCFTKEFAFTTVNQNTLTNEAQVNAFLDTMFRGDKALLSSIKSEPTADILTRFVDANTGICYGSSRETYVMKSGQVVEMKVRWSATVVKERGGWKIALAHVGTDFLENPVLDRITKASRYMALIAALGGVFAGAFLTWALRRRRPRGTTGAS